MSASRIYVVATARNERRLVRATTRAVAVNHVAKSLMEAWVASQDDLVKLLSDGIEIERSRDLDQCEMFTEEPSEIPE